MNFPIFIARRYLFAKKSHNVINIISYISLIGIALGTFALVVVLSVYNGFDGLIKSLYTAFDPDIKITAVEGKTFVPDSLKLAELAKMQGVSGYSEVVEENVLLIYKEYRRDDYTTSRQHIAVMKGVDDNYKNFSGIALGRTTVDGAHHSYISSGNFELWSGSVPEAVVGIGIADILSFGRYGNVPLQVWVPKRGAKISASNAIEAMNYDEIYPAGTFQIESTFDQNYFFAPLKFARDLLNYTNQVSAIEIKLDSTANTAQIQEKIGTLFGKDFSVRNRYQQNQTLFKMMAMEKYVIYAILIFIITIVSFNIIGSISMLIVDKKKDISTLKTLGADDKTVKRIFFYEGCMIAFGGAVVGLVAGILLCLAQQKFKIVKLAFIEGGAYPVDIQLFDIFLVLVFVMIIGFVMAGLPVWYLSKHVHNAE